MRRLTIIVSALLIVFSGCFNAAKADTVPADKARKIAAGLLGGATKAPALKEVKIKNLDKDNPEFYVFNDSDGEGFVIVSGDDATMPVLGYSDKFSFAEGEQLPPNVAYWMEYMQRKVNYVRNHPQLQTKAGVPSINAKDFTPIKQLETALWDQAAPYYNETPTIGSEHTVTGCGQTAMAIMMKYHKWPDVGVGSTEAYSVSSIGTIAAVDLSQHSYNWDNMPNSYSSYTSEQAAAVAQLMADLGKAQKAEYGLASTGGTGSSPSTMGTVLATHFKYTNSLLVDRDDYSTEEWCSKLRAEIDANRPLLYAGWDTKGAGHSFIVDGYAKYNYFSINWGWSGHYNGYFAIDIFQSEGQGIGGNDGSAYSEDQKTYIGLAPNKTGSAAPALDTVIFKLLDNGLQFYQDTKRITKDTYFTISFTNTGTKATTNPYYSRLAIQKHNGEIIAPNTWYQHQSALLQPYYITANVQMGYTTVDIKFGERIVPLFKDSSGNPYTVVGNEDAQATYISTINAAYIDCAESYSAGQTFDKTISYGWSKPQQVTWTYDGELSDGDIVLTSGHHTICAILEYALPEYSEVLEIELDVN